jgi:hypothetical protein
MTVNGQETYIIIAAFTTIVKRLHRILIYYMHFVIAINVKMFFVVDDDVDNTRYLTSELEKINVEER